MTRLLIDIGHPAHVHLFRKLAEALLNQGWEVLFSVREKGGSSELLKSFGLKYLIYGFSGRGVFNKIISLFRKNTALYQIFKSFNPDITISHSSFYLAQISSLLKVPNITLEDTGNMEQVLLYLPFTDVILTPDDYQRNHGSRQIRYHGYHETAYLHPDYKRNDTDFKKIIPDTILLRLVEWTASHDIGHKGISSRLVDEILELPIGKYEIKILSEKPLPDNLNSHQLILPPDQLHDFLKKVRLYIGEGATLATECAFMGIPSVYVNSRSAGVIMAQEKAGLLYHFKRNEGVMEKVKELLSDDDSLRSHRLKAEEFLKDKINLTNFLVWFIENYPESKRIMKMNPDYQYRFR